MDFLNVFFAFIVDVYNIEFGLFGNNDNRGFCGFICLFQKGFQKGFRL